MTAFSKPAISISAQLQQWVDRGLRVTNRSEAEHYLEMIGYPQTSKAHMGMPDDWADDLFWRFF